MSLSAVLDEFYPAYLHLTFRYVLAIFAVAIGAVAFRKKPIQLAIATTVLWFFFLYARGHDYHSTLYVPILLYLFCSHKKHQNWFLVTLGLLAALPTTYPIFRLYYDIPNVNAAENALLYKSNPALYFAFLAQRPLCGILILGYLIVREFPWKFSSRIKA